MIRSLAFIAACVLVCASAICYNGNPPAAQSGLSLCTEYAASACCDQSSEGLLAQQFASYGNSFGNGGCKENIRRIGCAFVCDPNNGLFVSYNANLNTLTGSFDTAYVDNLYGTCANVCLNNNVISATFPNSTSFLGALDIPAASPAPAVIFTASSSANAYTGNQTTFSSSDSCHCLDGSTPVANSNLSLCVEYRGSACCSTQYENNLIAQLSSYGTEFGTSACAENIRTIGCAFLCGPNNGAYVGATLSDLTGRFSSNVATDVYDSCKGRCSSDGTNTIFQKYPNATVFMTSLDVPAQGVNPAVNFVVSSTNSYDTNALLAADIADQAGCPAATNTDTDTGSGAASLAASFAFVGALAAFFAL